MPTLTVDGKSGEFSEDKRLVLAIKELGVNIGHRCGGNGKCTTCRVAFESGEPDQMTVAEYNKLKEKDLFGETRLSCQLTCSQDMEITPTMTLENQEGWTDTGPEPDAEVKPEAVWQSRAKLVSEQG